MNNNTETGTANTSEASTMTQDASGATSKGGIGATNENATGANVAHANGIDGIPDGFADSFDLDALLAADFSDDDIMSQTHKGLPDYQEILKHLPENGRKLVSNLRAMTTRRTQEVADIKRDLEQQRQQLEMERAALYNGDFARHVDRLAREPVEPHDLYDPAGMKAQIQQEAAKMFQNMLKPMQEEVAMNNRRQALQAFKTQNPELTSDEYRLPIAKMLLERPELKLEDAFYIVKAKLTTEQVAKEKARLAEQTNERRAALRQTSTGTNASPTGTPQFRDAWDAYQFHKAQQAKIK